MRQSRKKLKQDIQELVLILEKIGIDVIFGKGDFKSGSCILKGEKVLVINRLLTLEEQIKGLISFLGELDVEKYFLKPSQRELLEHYQSLVKTVI